MFMPNTTIFDPCPIRYNKDDSDKEMSVKIIQRYLWFKDHPEDEEKYLREFLNPDNVAKPVDFLLPTKTLKIR